MKSNRTYPGGKNRDGVYQKIINMIPESINTVIEPFCGSAAILRRLPKDIKKIGFEIDPQQVLILKTMNELDDAFISNTDFFTTIKNPIYQQSNTLAFIDPPYPEECRKQPLGMYVNELTDEQHIKLLKAIKKFKCKVIICSYPNSIYSKYLKGWQKTEYTAYDRRNNARTEVMWYNYDTNGKLYTYQHLGNNYRERYKLKVKINRLISKINNLPQQEKYAIINAIKNLDNEYN